MGTAAVNVLNDYVVPAVAVVGLAQVWAIAAVRKFVLRPKVELFETGLVEVGFSQFGPTIALLGTIKSSRRDAFVAAIKATASDRTNHISRQFRWVAFRAFDLTLNAATPGSFQIPVSFLVSTKEPHPYNIVFHDPEMNSAVAEITRDLQIHWNKHVIERKGTQSVSDFLAASLPECESTFYQLPKVIDAFERLKKLSSWQSHDYDLTLAVELSGPRRTVTFQFAFGLNQDDIDKLLLNAMTVTRSTVDTAVGRQSYPLNFAVVPYRKKLYVH